MARGFEQLALQSPGLKIPAVECVQPVGNNTIAGPLREGAAVAREVACTSQVSGLQVASVVDGHLALAACRATGGTGHLVSDEFVWEIQKRLAREEGIFTEPAGAVALAGAVQAARNGELAEYARVVCAVTGSGFKDMAAVDRMNRDEACPLLGVEALDYW